MFTTKVGAAVITGWSRAIFSIDTSTSGGSREIELSELAVILVVVIAVLTTHLSLTRWGGWGIAIAFGIITMLSLLFRQLLPRLLTQSEPEAKLPRLLSLSNPIYLPVGTFGMAVHMTTGSGVAYSNITATTTYPGPDFNITCGNGKGSPFAAAAVPSTPSCATLAVTRSVTASKKPIDQPPGVVKKWQALLHRYGERHDAMHEAIECLAETLWRAQRDGMPPDAVSYLECLEGKART